MKKKIIVPILSVCLLLFNVVLLSDVDTESSNVSLLDIKSAYAGDGEIGWFGSVFVRNSKQEAVQIEYGHFEMKTISHTLPNGTVMGPVTLEVWIVDGYYTTCRNRGGGC